MAILTATEVTVYSSISASVATIIAGNLIPIMQETITTMLNNYFVTELYLQDTLTFNATARTIVANNSFESKNFLAGDDIFLYGSYRNDGYFTLDSVSGSTLTVISGQSVVDELSGRSILVSVVKWPIEVKKAAALMIAYDYDVRPKKSANLKSFTLGPYSETYNASDEEDSNGYPKKLTDKLMPYRTVRMM